MSRSAQDSRAPRPGGRGRRGGFTIIELLVVIAIIVVLAALIFGLTRGVVIAAQKTDCTNNMRQIGMGIMGYAGETGKFPGEELGVNFDVAILPYFGIETERTITGRNPVRKRRYPEIAAVAKYFDCPLDKFPRDDRFYKRSYSIVPWATNWNHGGVSRGWLDRPPNTGVSVTAVKDPSQAALLVEWHVEGNLFGGGSYVYADQGNSKHGNGAANTLFVDGHVEAIPRINDFVQRYWPGRIGPAN